MALSSLRLKRRGRRIETGPAAVAVPEAVAAQRSILVLAAILLVAIPACGFAFWNGPYAEAREHLAAVTAQNGSVEELAERDARTDLGRERLRLGAFAAAGAVAGWFMLVQAPRVRNRADAVSSSTLLCLIGGGILLASRLVAQKAIPDYTAWGVADVAILHILASAIVPWSAKESLVPFGVLLAVWAATFLVPAGNQSELLDRVVGIIVSPLALLPGAMLAEWRRRRREETEERVALDQQVRHMGGELSRARIVHDSMFPSTFDGPIAFDYVYEPIAEIGGDYVHVRTCPRSGRVTLTLLDVAGHGLAAALTVNRLFGELERIHAEHGEADPAEIMTLLNRYIYLTMATHSMYATGACVALDPASGRLAWVNAGHPPAIVRRTSGETIELATTSVLLGALPPEAYAPEQQEQRLVPGETIVAYTDGAFEARDPRGTPFGMRGVRNLLSFDPPPRSWPRFIASAVAEHHAGRAEDDVLIASLTLRSLRVARPRPVPTGATQASGTRR